MVFISNMVRATATKTIIGRRLAATRYIYTFVVVG